MAYFRRLKTAPQKILTEWKMKTLEGRRQSCLSKSRFPEKLKELVAALEEGNGRQNMIAGFWKCELCRSSGGSRCACFPRHAHGAHVAMEWMNDCWSFFRRSAVVREMAQLQRRGPELV